jgi:integrase
MAEKYEQSGLRKKTKSVTTRNGRVKEVTVWRGYLKYRAPNPRYLDPPAEGEDTRTQTQRRKTVWLEITTSFDPETVRTQKQARDELARWKARMEDEARRDSLPSATTTVGDYVSSFIDDLEASGNVERRTASDYRTTAKQIAAGFSGVALLDLTPTMIQKWENGLTRRGLSPATVLKYHRLLSEVCKHAVNIGELDWNPCAPVKTPKRAEHSPNSLTAEGCARLAATLDAMEPTPLVTAAAIALHTGMRQGEVCGLRWRNYDRDAATITIDESIGKAGGTNYSKAPKTKASRRSVPVSPQLAAALERRRDAMVRELEEGGVTLGSEEFGALYVVGYVDGRFHSPSLISRGWKALSGAFGLTGTQGRAITFHDLRHSFATRAIAAGADVKAVAAVLGHTNAAVTLNVYADADPESKRRASDLVSNAIAAQGEVEPYAELAGTD